MMPEELVDDGKPRARMSGADRKQQLLDVALELFSRQGFERTTVRDIANAAEVTDGLIYRYFASKEELLAEVVDRARRRLEDVPIRYDPDRPVIEVLSDVIRGLANSIRANLTLVDLHWGEMARGSEVGIHLTAIREDVFAMLGDLLAQYAAAGTLSITDPILGARLLASTAFSFTCVNRAECADSWHALLAEWSWFAATTFVEGTRPRS
ncbi:MAG: TetR/AcrR family transcriptional regulator [Armatimonadetes bacterium]|nr:TetR/AcrR family transcriptional regulator [Armatimonadota bacterium]